MEIVYVRAYPEKRREDVIAVPLETLIVLFVCKCIQIKSILITFVLEESSDDVCFHFYKSSTDEFNVVYQEHVPCEVKNCILPVICKQNVGIYIAGLCAVLRRLLKNSSQLGKRLLGFRGGCLMACSEVSVWTKFCEIDLPITTKRICSRTGEDEEDMTHLFADVTRLEAHLQQPVRVHNISKRRQDLAKADKKRSETCKRQQDSYSLADGSTNCSPPCMEEELGRSSSDFVCDLTAECSLSGETGELTKKNLEALPAWMLNCAQFSALENRIKREDLSLQELIKQVMAVNLRRPASDSSIGTTNNEKVSTKVEALPQLCHLYAEGSDMTLADMVIFPCIYHILCSFKNQLASLQRSIPLVLRWYIRMTEDQNISLASQHFLLNDIKTQILSPLGEVTECSKVHASSANCSSRSGILEHDASLSHSDIIQSLNDASVDEADSKKQETTLHNVTPLTKPSESLYIRDPKRYRPQSRIFTRQTDVTNVLSIIQNSGIQPIYESHPCKSVALDWTALPEVVHPTSGELPSSRVERKCQQIENLVSIILKIAKPGDVIVDFCSGGGHVGIVLAYLLPHCQIIMIDNKEDSLARAHQRVQNLGLINVLLYQGNLDYFCGTFTIGTCLHACGVATDLVLQRCIEQKAAFVVCPCCYGGVQKTHLISYPRSAVFSSLKNFSYSDYLILGHAADQNHVNNPKENQGKQCMGLIDTDRLRHAEECGYIGSLCTLIPESCSLKHNLLIGHPESWDRPLD